MIATYSLQLNLIFFQIFTFITNLHFLLLLEDSGFLVTPMEFLFSPPSVEAKETVLDLV